MPRLLRMTGSGPLLGILVLILAPGLALGAFGFRALAEREQGLRTSYTATTVLVRDRVAEELNRLEAAVSPPADLAELAAVEAASEWLRTPFILRADGSVVTSGLRAGRLPHPPDPLEAKPVAAAGVADAEQSEFVRRDLEAALALYRRALTAVPPAATTARAFVLARIGRTLFKLRRLSEGIAEYEAAAAIAGDSIDRNGLPFAVIALQQIADGSSELRHAEGLATARARYERFVLSHPWDIDHGYALHLGRLPASAPASAISARIATVNWVRQQVYPRLTGVLTGRDARPGELRHATIPGDPPILLAYRSIGAEADGGPAIFGYEIRRDYVAGPLLTRVLKAVDLGEELRVSISEDGISPVSLAEADLLPSNAHWRVALSDRRGRSIPQLVARERWAYGALIAGMLAVMTVGIALTLRASARATELARARTDFVANVSHELKTPLALIRMFGETLESGIVSDPEKRQEFYGIIRRESERLTHLIDNVLDSNRIDQGTKQDDVRPQDLVATAQTALDAYRPLFDRLGFAVHTSFPPAAIALPLDREAIVQSLVNLFQNVIKYSPDERYVSVTVQRDRDTASVSVTDRGVGIPADQIDKVFERHYRVPGTAPTAGSGLGLAIVKHTMEAHGGRVRVESTPGRGSVFTLVFR